MSYQPPTHNDIRFDVSHSGPYTPPAADDTDFKNLSYTVINAAIPPGGRETSRAGVARATYTLPRARESNYAGGADAVVALRPRGSERYTYLNNFQTTLLTTLEVEQTILAVEDAAPLTVIPGRIQLLTLQAPDAPEAVEIVRLVAREGVMLVVERAYEGSPRTTPWPIGTVVSARVTARMLDALQAAGRPWPLGALTAGTYTSQEVTLQGAPVALHDPGTWWEDPWQPLRAVFPGEGLVAGFPAALYVATPAAPNPQQTPFCRTGVYAPHFAGDAVHDGEVIWRLRTADSVHRVTLTAPAGFAFYPTGVQLLVTTYREGVSPVPPLVSAGPVGDSTAWLDEAEVAPRQGAALFSVGGSAVTSFEVVVTPGTNMLGVANVLAKGYLIPLGLPE